MESSQKQGGSDSSSEDNEVKEFDPTSINKRSYECTFCKRGFTNAQALGGHMNIHRKDRAKTKQTTKPMLISEDYMNPRHLVPISNDPSRYYPVFESQRNYLMCYQPSASSPRHPPAFSERDFIVPRPQSWSMNQEILGSNLSLGLGPTCVEDNEVRRGNVEEAGLDLELRLGRNRKQVKELVLLLGTWALTKAIINWYQICPTQKAAYSYTGSGKRRSSILANSNTLKTKDEQNLSPPTYT